MTVQKNKPLSAEQASALFHLRSRKPTATFAFPDETSDNRTVYYFLAHASVEGRAGAAVLAMNVASGEYTVWGYLGPPDKHWSGILFSDQREAKRYFVELCKAKLEPWQKIIDKYDVETPAKRRPQAVDL